MKVLIVEDDHFQAEWISAHLEKELPNTTCTLIKTESAFRSAVDSIATDPPDIIVMDVMLRWADPQPVAMLELPPDDIKMEGFFRAGLRCARLLQKRDETKDVPVILYTVLENRDLNHDISGLPETVVYLSKSPAIDPLVEKVRRLLVGSRTTGGRK